MQEIINILFHGNGPKEQELRQPFLSGGLWVLDEDEIIDVNFS